jgi:hypothetical protein
MSVDRPRYRQRRRKRRVGVFVGGPLIGGGGKHGGRSGRWLVSWRLDDVWIFVVGPFAGSVFAGLVGSVVLEAFAAQEDSSEERRAAAARVAA